MHRGVGHRLWVVEVIAKREREERGGRKWISGFLNPEFIMFQIFLKKKLFLNSSHIIV